MAASELRRVRTELPWRDPLAVMADLQHEQGGPQDPVRAHGPGLREMPAPVMLHGAGAHPDARRSVIAMAAAWEARCHDGVWTLTERDEAGELPGVADAPAKSGARAGGASRILPGRPVEVLQRLAAGMHHDIDEDGFTGGIVGYFGYGFTHHLEPSIPPQAADTPEAVLWLCRDALVFDHAAQNVTLWSADLEGETGAAPRAAAFASWWAKRAVVDDPHPLAPPVPGGGPLHASQRHTPGSDAASGEAFPMGGPPKGSVPGDVGQPWQTSMDETAFCDAVDAMRRLIFEGDLFQVNIATRFAAPCDAAPLEMFAQLADANPSPYMALIDAGDHQVVSCSPELLVRVEEGRITTRPIAGTRKRGRDADEDAAMEAELLADPKEQAEHTMLVDLLRNDVARVAVPGSVHVPERMSVERYRHVMHLVSRVEAAVRPGSGFVDWLGAVFPGGTITGAPKHRACLRIAQTEPVARGPYTGSAGYLSWSHNAQWNILIRTLVLQDGKAQVHAGSGIVADSDPRREWRETRRKARALLEAALPPAASATIAGAQPVPAPTRLGEVTRHGTWAPPVPRRVPHRRVLLVDNFDSFTHNLADHVAAAGAQVHVVRNDGDWQAAVEAFRPTHIILSPGPGRPEDSGASLGLLQAALADASGSVGATSVAPLPAPLSTLPILGVCLGHQAMGLATGAQIVQVPPVHGRADPVHHAGRGMFAGMPSPMTATRYHSLAIARPGPDWETVAWLDDGTVMAMQHASLPWHGLQFHPESLCTDMGVEILARFLELEHGRHRVRRRQDH